jgi:hypothetical protein
VDEAAEVERGGLGERLKVLRNDLALAPEPSIVVKPMLADWSSLLKSMTVVATMPPTVLSREPMSETAAPTRWTRPDVTLVVTPPMRPPTTPEVRLPLRPER